MYDDSFRKRYGDVPIAISKTENFTSTNAHIHNEIEILYIENGSSVVRVSDCEYKAAAGSIIFVDPLSVHSVIVNKDAPYSHRCICFDPTLIVDKKISAALQQGEMALPKFFSPCDSETKALAELFTRLYEAVEENKETLLFDVTASISMMFSILLSNRLLSGGKVTKETKFTREIIDHLSSHFAENITSKTVAEALFYNQSYFCRIFKKNFGVSFSVYLNIYRISMAKQMLKTTAKKISEIMNECGFSNAAHFTRSFKKSVGMTPHKYRKSQHSTK